MYDKESTNIQTPMGIIESFPVKVGLHQGSTLSAFIFTIIMEEISKSIWETVPWCILFADDIVHISRTRKKYLRCNFTGTLQTRKLEVTIGEEVVASTTKFRYLGSIIQSNGKVDGDVTHRIQAGWLKWQVATRILYDRMFSSRLKVNFTEL